jgi:PKD repeat protein
VAVESDATPNASFTVAPETPATNESVTFDASASTDDEGIASYNWTVAGDRVNATDPVTSETFTEPGEYAVTLTVVDTVGQTDSVTRSVRVTDRVMFSPLRAVSPSRVDETTPLGTELLVRDLIPNATASSELNVSISVNGTVRTETNVTVTEGETRRLSIPISFEETGTYDVSLDGTVSFDGTTYDATTGPAEMVVVGENDSVSPPVVGERDPTSLDDDPTLEDVDGDGTGDVTDVMAYYQQRRSDVVRDNPGRFDFDGDGVSGTVFDAVKLYRELT